MSDLRDIMAREILNQIAKQAQESGGCYRAYHKPGTLECFYDGELDVVAIASAALDAVQQAAWQPIETAPKDRPVWLYLPEGYGDGPYMQKGEFDARLDGWFMVAEDQCGGAFRASPTHWLPLPLPPEN